MTKATRQFTPTPLRVRSPVPADLEIAQEAELKPIIQLAEEFGLLSEELELYGSYKAKVRLEVLERLKDRYDLLRQDRAAGAWGAASMLDWRTPIQSDEH